MLENLMWRIIYIVLDIGLLYLIIVFGTKLFKDANDYVNGNQTGKNGSLTKLILSGLGLIAIISITYYITINGVVLGKKFGDMLGQPAIDILQDIFQDITSGN
jgi:hypothetical protein